VTVGMLSLLRNRVARRSREKWPPMRCFHSKYSAAPRYAPGATAYWAIGSSYRTGLLRSRACYTLRVWRDRGSALAGQVSVLLTQFSFEDFAAGVFRQRVG
jgi:hypothetical protein